MLIRLSVEMGGKEVFSYNIKKLSERILDPQITLEFFKAIREFSKTTDQTIPTIQFFNMMLYSKTYEKFTFRLLIDELIEEADLEKYWKKLSKAFSGLSKAPLREVFDFNDESFFLNLEKILNPHIQDPRTYTKDIIQQESISKIMLVGLAKAGKTSIKYRFFENWSKILGKEIKPTLDVDISNKFQEFILHKLLIFDMGGQSTYRENHLTKNELWKNISLICFVVDIQDPDTFEKAQNYLTDVWKIVSKVNERKPKLSIFLHKYDPEKRKDLTKNISKYLVVFKDFISMSNIYMTTIEDMSSNIALIKSLYFSLPEVVLIRLLEKEFLVHFERKILPKFSIVEKTLSKEEYIEAFQNLKKKIRKIAIKGGITYGLSFQKIWLNHLMGKKKIRPDESSLRSIIIIPNLYSLVISIKDWTDQGIPQEMTTPLLDGFLEGILKTLHLVIDEGPIVRNNYITWKVMI